jgi:ankyrin repeat protein
MARNYRGISRGISLWVVLIVVGCSSHDLMRPHVDPPEVQLQRILVEGTVNDLTALLASEPALATQQLPSGRYPIEIVLISSSRNNEIGMLSVLISGGADVNTRSVFGGQTPLMLSASRGDIGAASVLVVHGAMVDLTDHHGHTALDQACYLQHLDVARLLVTSGSHETLMNAAFLGDVQSIRQMLRTDAALIDQRGTMPAITPFDAALLRKAKTGDQSAITVMLAYKANISVHEAAALGRIDLLRAFATRSSAPFTSTDPTGRSALDWALLEHEREAAIFLLDHGASPTTMQLVQAIRESDESTVKLLLKYHVDKDTPIPGQGTPRSIAYLLGNYQIAQLLN